MKKKLDKKLVCKLLGISEKSYYRWRDNRKIFKLLEKYFTEEDLQEFLQIGKIQKFDNLLKIQNKVINTNSNKYLSTFTNNLNSSSLLFTTSIFQDFYFQFLVEFNSFNHGFKISSLISQFYADYYFNFKMNSINQTEAKTTKIKKYTEEQKALISKVAKSSMNNLKDMTIATYIELFSEWDELMAIFLSINVDSYFHDLFIDDTVLKNELKRKEAYFHIIGLYVYRNHIELSSFFKIEIIEKIFNKISHKIFAHNKLMEFLKENTIKIIEELRELGLDKAYRLT